MALRPGQWLLASSSVVSIIFGSVVFAVAGAGAAGIALILGMHATAPGLVLVTPGSRMRAQLVAV